ncbi:hypothetical protein GLOTRDRAFT_133029 [Gloeophyllum trabeum ATCC 11539]|uniref:C2H2-type domain-containing protein n=1 Tax=Gloeophyllum trabeum (strain ATCC 11539 / FP-39264 / Madison 617) TaxID=670483 RepID=S7RBN9_GLOTA|nr:uncharacterized protein GLOTRDRAFT_133029 [Gloeophyllum trabeum ATCC 11539]EPQ51660.1 hypothetical protein GLOTRDRAFT_133029 [Gloeophyllum trabeum ATCC 11539]
MASAVLPLAASTVPPLSEATVFPFTFASSRPMAQGAWAVSTRQEAGVCAMSYSEQESHDQLHRDALANGVALRDITPSLSNSPELDDGDMDDDDEGSLSDDDYEGNLSDNCDGRDARRLDDGDEVNESDLDDGTSDEEDGVDHEETDQTEFSVVERPSRRVTRKKSFQKRANKGANPVNVGEDRYDSAALAGTRHHARDVQQGKIAPSTGQAPISNDGGPLRRKRKAESNLVASTRKRTRGANEYESTPETGAVITSAEGDEGSSECAPIPCLWKDCGVIMEPTTKSIKGHLISHVPRCDSTEKVTCQWGAACAPFKGETGHRKVQRRSFLKHLLSHAEIKAVLKHQCPLCGSPFARKDEIARHQLAKPNCASGERKRKDTKCKGKKNGRK